MVHADAPAIGSILERRVADRAATVLATEETEPAFLADPVLLLDLVPVLALLVQPRVTPFLLNVSMACLAPWV